jgi:hypothetical protein
MHNNILCFQPKNTLLLLMQPFYGLTHMGYIEQKCNRPTQNTAEAGWSSFQGKAEV